MRLTQTIPAALLLKRAVAQTPGPGPAAVTPVPDPAIRNQSNNAGPPGPDPHGIVSVITDDYLVYCPVSQAGPLARPGTLLIGVSGAYRDRSQECYLHGRDGSYLRDHHELVPTFPQDTLERI